MPFQHGRRKAGESEFFLALGNQTLRHRKG
jgi:hypothetical protein